MPLAVLRVINDAFSIIFFLELLIRIAAERRAFVNDVANWFDAGLAIAGLTDFALSRLTEDSATTSQSATTSRVFPRFWRLFRAFWVKKDGKSALGASFWHHVYVGITWRTGLKYPRIPINPYKIV